MKQIAMGIFILTFMLAFLMSKSQGYGFGDGNLRTRDELACEDYQINLRCPGNDIMIIKAAAYGRQDDMICVVDADQMQDMHCSLLNAKEVVAKRCNGNTSCSFTVGSGVFEDPCPGTKKYLNVMYECVPFIISCPGDLQSVSLPIRKSTSLKNNAAWMKDPYQVSDRLFYMDYTSFAMQQLYEYESVEDMNGGRPKAFYSLRQSVDGTGFVVYDRSVFFTPSGTGEVVRVDLSTQEIAARVDLPQANHGGTSPYSIGLSTDIDLAVDENGLWAIYATEDNEGKIVISRLKHHGLEIVKTWNTGYDKLSALNTFMVCGVLYMVNDQTLKIDHMFNTTSNTGTNIDIRIPGLRKSTSSINYNPKEQKLYAWDQKKAITYQLNFAPVAPSSQSTTTTTTTITTTTPTTTTISTTTRTPLITPVGKIHFCPKTESGGVVWPASKYGAVVKIRCPAPSLGNAIWICGGNSSNPSWIGKEPNFGQCVSDWIQEVQRQLDDNVVSATDASDKYLHGLQQAVNAGSKLSTWDIVKSVKMQREILVKATSDRESAAELMGSMLKTASILLDRPLDDSWALLSREMQNEISSELVRVVEDAAFFLAYDMSIPVSNPSQPISNNKLNWPEKMVSLGIRVDPIPDSPRDVSAPHERVIWRSGQGNMVRLDTNAILSAANEYSSGSKASGHANQTVTRHLAVVLLSFRKLGRYLNDIELYKTHLQPVDSKVISVSAASITRTTESGGTSSNPADKRELSVIVNRLQTMDLASPLRMTFTHKNPSLEYHVCAFWDNKDRSSLGRWWRSGCRAVEVNSTHSVCECDHMTSFAVLSSNVPFPLMGSNPGGTRPPTPLPYVQRDLPILRAGLCISLLFLLLVAVTLVPLGATKRLQNDLNTIHKNLILSLIVTEVVFLVGIDRNLVPVLCGVVAGLLHLALLATFIWAALEAFHLMVVLGDITERRDRWRWYYVIGYGAPIVVVAVSAAADHTGYGSRDVCWLETDGSFIWSFIGPCCFAILCCIAFLSITMYKLHLYTTTFTDGPEHKSVRSGVTRSCVLMFLLCALWSCGVLWLSNFQPRITAILFCVLSALYGLAAFFLHCILPSEVRKYYSSCFSRIAKRSQEHSDDFTRHRQFSNNSHNTRLGSATTHGGNTLRGMTLYDEYHTTRTGCTTTLLPVSAAQSASLAIEQGRCASDMDIARRNRIDSSRYGTHRDGHSDGSVMDLDTAAEHRQSLIHHTHPGHGEVVRWPEHRYEQPLPQIPNCSTIASGASGHYNHLHENYPSGSHHHLVPAARCGHPQRFNHHYETMDFPQTCKECPAELGVQVQMGENGEPRAVHYRHHFDDSQQHHTVAFTAPVRRSRGSFPCCEQACDQTPSTMQHGMEMDKRRSAHYGEHNHDHTAINRGYLTHTSHHPSHPSSFTARHGHIKMGTSDLAPNGRQEYGPPQRRSKQGGYQPNRAGRSSDPLSTDQGYDTDNQQHGCRACCDSQSDNDHSCSPRPPSLPKPTLVVRSLDTTVLPTIAASSDVGRQVNGIIAPIPIKRVPKKSNRGNSISEESLCSENDKEVERIISSTQSTSSSPAGHGDSGNFDDIDHEGSCNPERNVLVNHNRHGAGCDDVIDTACGGRLSVAESVTSWCAHAGSNPRAVNSSYGKGNKGKNKKTADPNVIIANAKLRADNGDTPPQGRSKTYVYTLPGTAAAGTKAKIDLKSGGISMITNL